MKTQWTPEQANEWYDKLPWLRGCNFIGSDCANRKDMYQSYGSEERLKKADEELALCEKIGFNTIRIVLEFNVWLAEHDSFMEIFEKYIAMAASHSIKVMVVLTGEALLPRGGSYTPPKLGEQFYALGYHQGRLPLTEEQKALTPYHYLELDDTKEAFETMIREVVGKYANDDRIIVWNVYNEPGIVIKDRAVPLLKKMFEICRELDPIQPLCADVWWSYYGKTESLAEQTALELSDVISFHSYMEYTKMVPQIVELKKLNRPIFMTEWLNRISFSGVRDIYPLFYIEKIACYCWGFVLGKTQTHEPWDDLWEHYNNDPTAKYDFTKWQHDLFRPNLRPYDPEEIKLIEYYNSL